MEASQESDTHFKPSEAVSQEGPDPEQSQARAPGGPPAPKSLPDACPPPPQTGPILSGPAEPSKSPGSPPSPQIIALRLPPPPPPPPTTQQGPFFLAQQSQARAPGAPQPPNYCPELPPCPPPPPPNRAHSFWPSRAKPQSLPDACPPPPTGPILSGLAEDRSATESPSCKGRMEKKMQPWNDVLLVWPPSKVTPISSHHRQ